MKNAQEIYWDDNSTDQELDAAKTFLPTIPYSEVKFYDAETGKSKFKVGDVILMGDIFTLVK